MLAFKSQMGVTFCLVIQIAWWTPAVTFPEGPSQPGVQYVIMFGNCRKRSSKSFFYCHTLNNRFQGQSSEGCLDRGKLLAVVLSQTIWRRAGLTGATCWNKWHVLGSICEPRTYKPNVLALNLHAARPCKKKHLYIYIPKNDLSNCMRVHLISLALFSFYKIITHIKTSINVTQNGMDDKRP